MNPKNIKSPRHWTADEVIAEVKKLSDLSAKHNQRRCPCLYGAALRYFGSWGAAVRAAGFDYASKAKRRLPGYWTKEKVIAEIQCLAQRNSLHIRNSRTDLYSAALRLFGTWKAAIESAGLNYEDERRGWIASDSERFFFRKK